MKIVYNYVPKGMCVLDYLASLRERTEKAWIFCDNDCIEQMKIRANKSMVYKGLPYSFHWDGVTGKYPPTDVIIHGGESWNSVEKIDADDIFFKEKPIDPEEIIFLKIAQ